MFYPSCYDVCFGHCSRALSLVPVALQSAQSRAAGVSLTMTRADSDWVSLPRSTDEFRSVYAFDYSEEGRCCTSGARLCCSRSSPLPLALLLDSSGTLYSIPNAAAPVSCFPQCTASCHHVITHRLRAQKEQHRSVKTICVLA